MKPKDKKNYLNRYNSMLSQFGYSPKSLGWSGGEEMQFLRFKILSEIGFETNDSVLDIGCGFADLYGYLQKRRLNCNYLGLEINDNLLEVALKQYPSVQVKLKDILIEPVKKKYDWVVSSGIFNAKLESESNVNYITEMLGKMIAIANKGVAVDFLSSYVDYQGELSFHLDPGKAIEIAKSLTDKIIVRMDYLKFEYTIYMYV
jgi:SAM-dependent methyltransferase